MNAPALPWAGGAAAVVILAAGLVWRVHRRKQNVSINDPESVAHVAEQALPGFEARGAIIGDDGGAALVVARDGRMAVVRRRGARLRVSETGPRMLAVTPAGLEVQGAGRRVGKVLLVGVDALDVRRLVPAA